MRPRCQPRCCQPRLTARKPSPSVCGRSRMAGDPVKDRADHRRNDESRARLRIRRSSLPRRPGEASAGLSRLTAQASAVRRQSGLTGARGCLPRPPPSRQPDHPASRLPHAGDARRGSPATAYGVRGRRDRLQLRSGQFDCGAVPRHLRDAGASRIPALLGPGRARGARRARLLAGRVETRPAAREQISGWQAESVRDYS